MALSNWDTCAFNTKGESSDGILTRKFEDGSKSSVRIYKNWLYVNDSKMWCDGRSYVEDTIAEIHQGHVILSGLKIYANRGPQSSVLVYAEHGWKHEGTLECMCGIGCYGFGDSEWVGVQEETLQELFKFLKELEEKHYVGEKEYIDLF